MGTDQNWQDGLCVGRLDKTKQNKTLMALSRWPESHSHTDNHSGEYTPVPSDRKKEPLTHQRQGSGFLFLWRWFYIGTKSYITRHVYFCTIKPRKVFSKHRFTSQ